MCYVQSYTDQHGKRKHYYRRGGRKVRISGEFNKGYTGEWLPRFPEDTFGYAVEQHYESERFQKLKKQTRYAYQLEIGRIVEAIGEHKIASITRGMVVALRDKVAKTSPRRACEVVKVMKVIFQCACDLDLVDPDVTKDVKNPVGYTAKPHEPWPQDHIDRFLAHTSPAWRRALMVLLHTGLRRDDAVSFRRDQIINGRICLTIDDTGTATTKTGAEVVIPISEELEKELATPLPVEGLTLIVGTRGRPVRGDVLYHSIKKEARRSGIEDMRPLHGLRKNAVMTFLELGLEKTHIRAITGQSDEMISHYGRNYNRHRVIDQAVVIMGDKNTKK